MLLTDPTSVCTHSSLVKSELGEDVSAAVTDLCKVNFTIVMQEVTEVGTYVMQPILDVMVS